MHLSDYSVGRDNNFNLVRFIAASLVLVTHSFALSTGSADAEPLRSTLGVTWGSIAVDIFFVTSGFLVTGSLLTRKDIVEFVVARFLRIYPGLWVALILTVIAAGLFFTTLPPAKFFLHIETWKYLLTNGSILKATYYLPGVFEDLPWKKAVNGSLWTLPAEVRMYCALAVLWLIARKWSSTPGAKFSAMCVVVAVVAAALHITTIIIDTHSTYISLGFMFFAGAAMRVLQDKVLTSRTATGLMISAIALATLDKTVFGVVYSLCIPYLVIYLALIPGGSIRKFNQLGDYSYGIYIYAFPVQQMLAFFWRGISPYEMMAASFVITLPLAVASWVFVEKRALGLKRKMQARGAENALRFPSH